MTVQVMKVTNQKNPEENQKEMSQHFRDSVLSLAAMDEILLMCWLKNLDSMIDLVDYQWTESGVDLWMELKKKLNPANQKFQKLQRRKLKELSMKKLKNDEDEEQEIKLHKWQLKLQVRLSRDYPFL